MKAEDRDLLKFLNAWIAAARDLVMDSPNEKASASIDDICAVYERYLSLCRQHDKALDAAKVQAQRYFELEEEFRKFRSGAAALESEQERRAAALDIEHQTRDARRERRLRKIAALEDQVDVMRGTIYDWRNVAIALDVLCEHPQFFIKRTGNLFRIWGVGGDNQVTQFVAGSHTHGCVSRFIELPLDGVTYWYPERADFRNYLRNWIAQ